MNIRRPLPSDVEKIHALDRTEFGPAAYPRVFFRQAIDLWPSLTWVAEENGVIVGYAVAAPNEDRSVAWILAAVVDTRHRRGGIGRMLLQALLDQIGGIGLGEVRLTVAPTNSGALHLYNALGFRIVGEEASYFGEDEPRLVLGLMLAPHPR